MVRLIPQVAPISPQRRINRSCETRSCCAGVLLGSTAGAGGVADNVAAAMTSPVSVCTETIAYADAAASGFSSFSEIENRKRDYHRDTEARRPTCFTAQ